jgi:benzodiazapine receptor
MNAKDKSYISLMTWIVWVTLIGFIIGSLTKTEVNTWYSTLNRSNLTPPNYVFGIVWTILYPMLAICGWIIWHKQPFQKLMLIKSLYMVQLILNWSWTPLFFRYHLTGLSFACLLVINIFVAMIIYFSYTRVRLVSLLMIPYLIWMLFATYLNFYILQYN